MRIFNIKKVVLIAFARHGTFSGSAKITKGFPIMDGRHFVILSPISSIFPDGPDTWMRLERKHHNFLNNEYFFDRSFLKIEKFDLGVFQKYKN